jgi:hypothetical protein
MALSQAAFPGALPMFDVLFVAGSVAFFLLGALFVRACDLI